MKINGTDISVNVLILSMEHEIDVLMQTVESLLVDLEDGVTISILLNGQQNECLRKRLESIPCVRYYESPENLGVAGGRNYLCSTEEFRSADVICILDNDVIVPRDYLRRIATHLVSDQRIGAAGGVVVDIRHFYPALERYKAVGGRIIEDTHDLTCKNVQALFMNDPTSAGLYHVGTSKNWFLAYLTPLSTLHILLNSALKKLHSTIKFSIVLKDDSRYLRRIIGGTERYEVSNVAGCTQSFRRSLLDEIGNFDTMFSPYGLEDVDFNVRAQRAGYRNYTFCDVWLLHGTDSRHKERRQEWVFENFYRVLTIFSHNHTPWYLSRHLVSLRIWCNRLLLWAQRNKNSKKYFDAQMRGFHKGLQELERGAPLIDIKRNHAAA